MTYYRTNDFAAESKNDENQTQMAEDQEAIANEPQKENETKVSLSEYAEIVKENAELKSQISELKAKNEALTKNILAIVRPVSDCIDNELEMFGNTASLSSLDLLLKRANAEPSDVAMAIIGGNFKEDCQAYCQTDYKTMDDVLYATVRYKIEERDLREAANERRAKENGK